MKIAYIDAAFSGVSGDMMLAALADLAEDGKALRTTARAISTAVGCKIALKLKRRKGAIAALYVDSKISGGRSFDLEKSISEISDELGLKKRAAEFAANTASTLIHAERAAHRKRVVDLHELGEPDTLLDILGTAVLAEQLGFFDNVVVYSTQVKVGSGSVDTAHGRLPVPAPVTSEILKRYRIPFAVEGKGELATPTGVALLANLASFAEPPALRIDRIGAGLGSRKEASNLLRIFTGESAPPSRGMVSVLETSVDDVSGEVLGYAMERLYELGALDVQIAPTTTKKNRPGHLVKVLCDVGMEEEFAKLLMSELGTLGVRLGQVQKRYQLKRESKEVQVELPGYRGKARVKIATDEAGIVNVKAEYEDAKIIARKTGLPLRRVMRVIEDSAIP